MRLWRRKRQPQQDLSPEAQAEQYLHPGHPLWAQLMTRSQLQDIGVEGFDEDGVPIGHQGEDMRPHLRAIIDKEKQ